MCKSSKTRILVALVVVIALTTLITVLGALLLRYIDTLWLKRLVNCFIYLLLAMPAYVAYKRLGGNAKELFTNAKAQLGFALLIAAVLSADIAIIPALLGTSLVGKALVVSIPDIAYYALFYIVFVGPAEEFVFRVFTQDAFTELLPQVKYFAPLFGAVLFGLWHWLNGSLTQVLFTTGIGLVFAYAKYAFKQCDYLAVALGHGLYDFLNVLVRMFIL